MLVGGSAVSRVASREAQTRAPGVSGVRGRKQAADQHSLCCRTYAAVLSALHSTRHVLHAS